MEGKDLYSENYKTLMNEMGKTQMKGIPYLLIEIISFIKMSILSIVCY